MRKIFTILAAALISVSAMAIDGVNVLASGLKKVAVSGDKMTIDYVLNTPATSLDVEFFDADNEIVALVEIEDAALLTEGKHRTTIDLPVDDLEEGTFSWAIHAYAGETVFENKLPVGDPRYSFYLPQDVVVDNSFESDFFGRIYVSLSCDGQAEDAGSELTANQKRGLFFFEPTMDKVNGGDAANEGFDGGIGGNRLARTGFKRLAIDEDGFIYVASRDEEAKGVYRANPADLSAPFETILAGELPVDAIEVINGKLITIEGADGGNGGFVSSYDLSTIPVAAPTKQVSAPERLIANSDLTIRSDHRGGYWVMQHRYGLDMWAALIHFDKKFNIDFKVNNEENTKLLSNSNGVLSYRGTLGVNVAGNLLAVSSNKQGVVFSIDWDDAGVPALTKVCETPIIANNIDGLAFDVADNLFLLTASSEQFHMYPISKEAGSNHSRVFAASKYNVTVGEETGVENAAVKSAPVKLVRDGQVIIIRNGVEFNLLGAQMK